MVVRIGCVTEGHGDVRALPVLIRRISGHTFPNEVLVIPEPIRIPRSKLVKPNELERAVELAALKVGANGAIFVSVDADDDCAAQLGPTLLARARAQRSNLPICVALPVREFEAWFIGRMPDLAGYKGIPEGVAPHPDPEGLRGAKGWLSRHMTEARYSETIDQSALAGLIDLEHAREMNSFDKFYRDIEGILRQLVGGP